ncbi:MAG: DUF2569 family protein [Rhodospirillales bacterium]|nr:DUF2569 family protein [Rhodospirillales bacterium]
MVERTTKPDDFADVSPEPSGLRGWLAVLMMAQIGGILQAFRTIAHNLSLIESMPKLADLAQIAAGLNGVMLAVMLATTAVMLKTKRFFPAVWKFQAMLVVVLQVSIAAVISQTLKVPFALVLKGDMLATVLGSLVVAIAGWIYLSTSVRVKNTFVD